MTKVVSAHPGPPGPAARERRAVFLAVALVVGLVLAAYHHSFSGEWVLDDLTAIVDNPHIRKLWPPGPILRPPVDTLSGRPLANLTFALDYTIHGPRRFGYHAVNLAIHIAAALTLLGLVRRTLLTRGAQPDGARPDDRSRAAHALPLALAVAGLWALHPLLTETVTYVSQRTEAMMGLCYLLTLYAFIRGIAPQSGRFWLPLSVVACAGGMASKEVMVTAPLTVLLYDHAFGAGSFRGAWRLRRRYYVALGATWLLLAMLMATRMDDSVGFGHQITGWQYLLTEGRAVLLYLRLVAWPHPLVFDYGPVFAAMSVATAAAALAVAMAFGGALFVWWRRPPLGFILIWFFVLLAPTSSVVPVSEQPIAENRMYLPSIAVIALAVFATHAVMGRRSVIAGATVALGFAWLTNERNQTYQSAIGLWNDTVAKRPQNPRAQSHLAGILYLRGRLEEAAGHYQEALRLKPDFAGAHSSYASVLLGQGRLNEAIAEVQEALRLKPDFADAHSTYSSLLFSQGRLPEAIAEAEAAVRANPRHAIARNSLAAALFRSGRMREGVVQAEEAVRLNPELASARFNLGKALIELGRPQEAVTHLAAALQLDPGNDAVRFNVGDALIRVGRYAEAAGHFEAILRRHPDDADAQHDLATALSLLGRFKEAIELWQPLLRRRPDLINAHYSLGHALEQLGRTTEAEAEFAAVLRLQPDHEAARSALARVHALQQTPP